MNEGGGMTDNLDRLTAADVALHMQQKPLSDFAKVKTIAVSQRLFFWMAPPRQLIKEMKKHAI